MGIQTAIGNLTTAPKNWLKCDGSSFPMTDNGSVGGTIGLNAGTFSYQQSTNPPDTYFLSTANGATWIKSLTGLGQNYTFMFWFKKSSAPSGSSANFINWFYNSTHNTDSAGEAGINTNGTLTWGPRHGSAATQATTTSSICDGNWHFIVLTRNTSGTTRIYVDGSQNATGVCGTTSTSSVSAQVIFGVSDSGTNAYDEWAFFDYEVSSTDISNIWNASPFAATNVSVAAGTGMATTSPDSVFVDPAISVQTNVQYTSELMDATNAELVGPAVSADTSTEYAADASTASAEQVDATISTTANFEQTETAWTVSAEMADPAVSVEVYVSVAADPATATADLSNNVFYGQTIQDTDYHVEVRNIYGTTSNTQLDNQDVAYLGSTRSGTAPNYTYTYESLAMKPQSGFPPYATIVKAKIDFTKLSVNATYDETPYMTFKIYVFTEAPTTSFGTMDYDNLPAKELLYTTRELDEGGSAGTPADQYIDLTAAFKDSRSHTYGILIEPVGDDTTDTWERTTLTPTGTYDWRYDSLYILTSDIQLVNVDASPVTASAEMTDVTVTTVNNITLTADIITASSEFVDPTLTTENNITFTDSPWTASATTVDPTILPEMVFEVGHLEASADIVNPTLDIEGTYIYYSTEPVGTASAEFASAGWNIGEENQSTHMDAEASMTDPTIIGDNRQYANEMNGNTAEMVDPAITVVLNANTVYATPMEANAVAPNPAYSRLLDPYYAKIKTIAGNASNLYIFDGLETDSYGKKPDLNPSQYLADPDGVFGVTYGEIITAPGSRKATQLVNSGITYARNLSSTSSIGGTDSAVEIVLRTSTSDAGQIYEHKIISGTGGLSEVKGFIRGGKLVFERWSYAGGVGTLSGTTTGFKNVADGFWHHIVVNFNDDNVTPETYYDAFIDGVRDHKRYVGFASATRADRTALVANLTADVMSIAYYELNLTQDQIVKNFYLALDIQAIEVDPMIAGASILTGAKGRGNNARAIMLYFRSVTNEFDEKDAGGTAVTNSLSEWENYDFGPGLNTDEQTGWNGAEIFPYPILGPWRDEVTDELRSINLDTDIDASDFDVVIFRNYPNESSEFDFITGQTQPVPYRDVWTKERETFCSNLISAINKHGLSLYVNDPQLAIDLGIVDKVVAVYDQHDTLLNADNGNAAGAGDVRSATIDPFVGLASASGGGYDPEYFSDTHTLARHRVVNSIDGVTDNLTSKYVFTDYTRYVPYNPFQVERQSYKYELGALNKDFYPHLVGDAGIYGGAYYSEEYGGRGRRNKLIITPPQNVKYGTILTAISPTYYVDNDVTANPYSGYATSIVIQPGQNLGNIQMNTKIYVNFTESMDEVTQLRGFLAQDETQLLTDITTDDAAFFWNNNNRSWQYSTWRISAFYTSSGSKGDFVKAPPQGVGTTTPGYYRVPKSFSANKNGFTFSVSGVYWVTSLPLIEQTQNYAVKILPAYTPAVAAWEWLQDNVIITDADAINRPGALTATVDIVDAAASTDVTVEIFTEPFVVSARIVQPTDYSVPDVTFAPLPMRAEADIKPSELRVLAEPMTASASISTEPAISTTGEGIVLILQHSDAVLYIKENI